jgi:hypothetical protein
VKAPSAPLKRPLNEEDATNDFSDPVFGYRESVLDGVCNFANQEVCEGDAGTAKRLNEGGRRVPVKEEQVTEVNKLLLQQQLIQLCEQYPAARPTRGNLKQVYQFARNLNTG